MRQGCFACEVSCSYAVAMHAMVDCATFESDAPCVPVRLFRLEIETEELYWHGALRVF